MTTPVPELERRPPCLPEELLASTLFLLARLGYATKARVIEEFEQAGFSMYQYGVLATLGEGDCATQATIADVLALDRSQLVHVLDDLEKRGLIERQPPAHGQPHVRRQAPAEKAARARKRNRRLRAGAAQRAVPEVAARRTAHRGGAQRPPLRAAVNDAPSHPLAIGERTGRIGR